MSQFQQGFISTVPADCVSAVCCWSAQVHQGGICPIRALTWSKPQTLLAVLSICTVPQNSEMENLYYLWDMSVSGWLVAVMDAALSGRYYTGSSLLSCSLPSWEAPPEWLQLAAQQFSVSFSSSSFCIIRLWNVAFGGLSCTGDSFM